MTILTVDTKANTILFEAALADCKLPIVLQSVNNFIDTIFQIIDHQLPDVLLVGLGIIIPEGIDNLLKIKSDEKLKALPFVVLTEFDVGKHNLFEEIPYSILFVSRPHNLDKMPALIDKIYEFGTACKQAV